MILTHLSSISDKHIRCVCIIPPKNQNDSLNEAPFKITRPLVMERLYTKRVNFKVADEETTTDVTETEEVFRCQPGENSCRQLMHCKMEDTPSEVLRRYGRRLCLRSEICEADTEAKSQPFCATQVPSDESFSEIIDMILKVYGNQSCKGKIQNEEDKSLSKESSTSDLAVPHESRLTQTLKPAEGVEIHTNTRYFDTSFSLMKGVCFRPFLGPSLDETGVYFRENLPMIRQFLGMIRDKIFKEDETSDEEESLDDYRIDPIRTSSPRRPDIFWENQRNEVGLLDESRVDSNFRSLHLEG